MFEALGGVSTLFGGLLGGIFRIIPEIFKYLDRKNERKHELALQDKMIEFQKLAGSQKIEEIKTTAYLEYDKGAMQALVEAIKGQETPSGIKWIDGFSKLMRPIITTQWVVLLYPSVIFANFLILLFYTNEPITIQKIATVLPMIFGENEKAICAGIINFWFLDRVLRKR